MVVLNDLGLTLEIIGFAIFLIVPLQETYSLIVGKPSKVSNFITEHLKFRYGFRYGGIGLIILGLIMQYSFLNNFT